MDGQGRESLRWIAGDVAIPPFPEWSFTDGYLASIGRLLRRLHDAQTGWEPPAGSTWNSELADPEGGELIVHADLCPENVVARDGSAQAVLDWEFAAPGRRVWDVVSAARLCVPFTHPLRHDPSVPAAMDLTEMRRRLLVLLDAYDLSEADREAFRSVLAQRARVGEAFVLGRVALGEKAFGDWATPEGRKRLTVEREWIAALPADVAVAKSL